MKKSVLFTLVFIGFVSASTLSKDPSKENEDYQWLIDEVEVLYEEEAIIEEASSMVFVYDQEGNEIVSFEEAAFDQLAVATKRTIGKSELLFETANDKIYMLSR